MRLTLVLASFIASGLVLYGGASRAYADDSIRGLVRALHEAWISSELNARIIHIARREGETFKKGEVLIAFECDRFESEYRAARAEQELNRVVLDNSVQLDRRGAIGRYEVAQNRAKLDKATAQAETLAVRVAECKLKAPYDGRIAEMKARIYETPQPNQQLMRVVNTENLEIEMIVPSSWMRWLRPGKAFQVRIDETATIHPAAVERIAPIVDSVSQTVKVMGALSGPALNILPGMSLAADLAPPAE